MCCVLALTVEFRVNSENGHQLWLKLGISLDLTGQSYCTFIECSLFITLGGGIKEDQGNLELLGRLNAHCPVAVTPRW